MRKFLLSGTSILSGVALCNVALPAYAQSGHSGKDTGKIEEITVTAQRRTENMQQVPISISAVSARTAKAMGITSTTDIGVAAPAVTFSQVNSGAAITIRGVGGSGAATDEAANAVYIDGVYQAAAPSLIFNMNNIERIEVEKGPQGTLFGRNSSGGLIQIITRDPSTQPSADFSIGYGNYDTREEQAYGTIGITSKLATDLAIYDQNQGTGWGKDITSNAPAYKGRASAIRNKWLWNIDDDTTARLSWMASSTAPATADGGTIVPGETTLTTGGVKGLPNEGFYNTTANAEDGALINQTQVALTLQHAMSWGTLVSISSWNRTDQKYHADADNGPAPFDTVTINNPVVDVTQELQLLSPKESPIKTALGLFYYDSSLKLDPFTQVGTVIPAAAKFSQQYSSTYAQSFAGYGQATAPVYENTHLTIGLRYTVDEHSLKSATYTALGEGGILNAKTNFYRLTYKFALDHQFSDNVLGYISDSSGFHSGFYNATTPTQPVVLPELVDAYEIGVKTELFDHKLRFNAAGFYNEFRDLQIRTINNVGGAVLLNAPQVDMKGVDLDFTARPIPRLLVQGGVSYLDSRFTDFINAPFYAVKPSGGLTQLPGFGDADGNETTFSSPWVASLAFDYTIPLPSGRLDLGGSNYYNGGVYFDAQNRVQQKAYDLVNASATWSSESGKYAVRLWAKNILNQQYYTYVATSTTGDTYYPGAPCTFGITLSYHY